MRTLIERDGGGIRVIPVAGQLFLREKAPAYITAASTQARKILVVVLRDPSRPLALLARNLDVKVTAAAAALYMKR